jgi:hypothetical protein
MKLPNEILAIITQKINIFTLQNICKINGHVSDIVLYSKIAIFNMETSCVINTMTKGCDNPGILWLFEQEEKLQAKNYLLNLAYYMKLKRMASTMNIIIKWDKWSRLTMLSEFCNLYKKYQTRIEDGIENRKQQEVIIEYDYVHALIPDRNNGITGDDRRALRIGNICETLIEWIMFWCLDNNDHEILERISRIQYRDFNNIADKLIVHALRTDSIILCNLIEYINHTGLDNDRVSKIFEREINSDFNGNTTINFGNINPWQFFKKLYTKKLYAEYMKFLSEKADYYNLDILLELYKEHVWKKIIEP